MELLSPSDPQGNVAALAQLLRPYLMQRGELLDFYHGQFREAVGQACLESVEKKRRAHTELAEYFHAQDYWRESVEDQRQRAKTLPPTPRPANVRKVDELPTQRLIEAQLSGQWDEVERLFTDLSFLEAKAELGMIFALASDFSAAVNAMPADRPCRRILRLLEEALRRDIHFISRHPTTFFQCLWNSCWWYDCPEVAKHYDRLPESLSLRKPAWEQSGVKLHELLASWRTLKERSTPGFPWLRTLRPPAVHLGRAQFAVLRGHMSRVYAVNYSPDGSRIVSGSDDKTVRVWDAQSGAELTVLRGHEGSVEFVAFMPDGQGIASLGVYPDRRMRLWNPASTQSIVILKHEGIRCAAISPNGQYIAGAGETRNDTVQVWRIAKATNAVEISVLSGHNMPLSVAFSPDGRKVVSGAYDQTVRIWDMISGKEQMVLRGHKAAVNSVAWSPDGRRIASGSSDRTVRVWDAESGAELAMLSGHEGSVNCVAFSPDSHRIASGGCDWIHGDNDRTVRVWSVESGEQLMKLCAHERSVKSVAFAPDGDRIISGSLDSTVRVWDVSNGETAVETLLRVPVDRMFGWSSDGRRFATSVDSTLTICDGADFSEVAVLAEHRAKVTTAAFSPDGQRVATGTLDNSVRIWSAQTGEQLAMYQAPEAKGVVQCVAFTSDGQQVVAGCAGEFTPEVRVLDAITGTSLRVLVGHSVVGQACLSDENTVRISLQTGSGPSVPFYQKYDEAFWGGVSLPQNPFPDFPSVAISPDGKTIAGGSNRLLSTVWVWDAATGKVCAFLRGHEFAAEISDLAFSLDGQRMVSVSEYDQTMRVWDARRWKCIEVIPGVSDITSIAAGFPQFAFWAIMRHPEIVIRRTEIDKEIAWFAEPMRSIRAHPNSRIWAGLLNGSVQMIVLEGDTSE